MVQLILGDGIVLPETSHDKYLCYPEKLEVQRDMISGRRVVEVRGTVQKISYAYDYMEDSLCRTALAVLRSKASFTAVYLPDDSDEMRSGSFLCESLTNPSFVFSSGGKPFWHNLAFTLREVRPHD